MSRQTTSRGSILGIIFGGIIVSVVAAPFIGMLFAYLLGAGHANMRDVFISTFGMLIACSGGVLTAALARGSYAVAVVRTYMRRLILFGSIALSIGSGIAVAAIRSGQSFHSLLGSEVAVWGAIAGLIAWSAAWLGSVIGKHVGE